MRIANGGDAAAIREAGDRLVEIARTIGSPVWIQAHREQAARANAAAGLAPTPNQEAVQLESWQTEKLAPVYRAMSLLGGEAIMQYCVRIASDSKQPSERRKLALDVLDRVVPAGHAERRKWQLALRASIDEERRQLQGVARVVASLRSGFRDCYNQQLGIDPGARYRIKLSLRVDPNGNVVDTTTAGKVPDAFVQCIRAIASGARFGPSDTSDDRVINVPLTFVPQE